MAASRLVLGTAQLGFSYGIANRSGPPDRAAAMALVRTAWNAGIREFDTAQGYGASESELGMIFQALHIAPDALVMSKFQAQLDHFDPRVLSDALNGTLDRLQTPHIFGMKVHDERLLGCWERMWRILSPFVADGRVQHLGMAPVSVDGALRALQTDGIDFIQIPTNIFDRRFEKAGVFQRALAVGKTVYIRSVFLQGLLLMHPEELEPRMAFAHPVVKQLQQLSHQFGVSRHRLALGYVKTKFPHARVIFGAETLEQVQKNCQAWEEGIPHEAVECLDAVIGEPEERVINPTLWTTAH